MINLCCDDIRRTLAAGATLLDVRTSDEFKNGALPDARNIPLAVLPAVAHEHLDKDETVFIYCRVGSRAMMAERILSGLGFSNAINIGGIHQYQHCS